MPNERALHNRSSLLLLLNKTLNSIHENSLYKLMSSKVLYHLLHQSLIYLCFFFLRIFFHNFLLHIGRCLLIAGKCIRIITDTAGH